MTTRRNHHSILLLLTGVLISVSWASAFQEEIHVNIREPAGSPSGADTITYLNGYRKSLSGERITYRSSHPDADVALLVRARKDAHSIAWETDSAPSVAAGGSARFIWLAGIECGGFQNPQEVHTFRLSVNGTAWFSFQNRKDSTAKQWTVTAPNGAELSFTATVVDRVGDLFGTMLLSIPASLVTPGKPLVLEVTGEDAGSGDWFMTFQYCFSFEPRARVEPVVAREEQGASQILRLSLDNLRSGRAIYIAEGNIQKVSEPLRVGSNIFFIRVPAVTTPRQIPLTFTVGGNPVSRTYIPVNPVHKRDVYLLSYSHNDIGYTDLQPDIERKQWRNLDEALRLIRSTKDYPEGARYKWNMEVLWSLDSYLHHASDSLRAEVLDAIRRGDIGLNAFYVNVLTGLANAVEMRHITDYARKFSVAHDVPITTALVSDVPGFTWGIVPALAESGVRYFSSSPNSGDRIGFTIGQWGEKPFYWQSQSGNAKILMWVAGESYASFHEGNLSRLGDEKLFKLFRKLDDTGYLYEIVQLPYTVGGDNGPPDPQLPEYVKRWNERYVTPRLIIATHKQMFEDFERQYGSTLRTVAGDFTPYWEDGAASSAEETALNREASNRLIQADALRAMKNARSGPDSLFAEAWRDVIMYDEHTWGAYNSISEPDLPFVRDQWSIKRDFALRADSLSRLLQAASLLTGAEKSGASFDIWNTNSWPRTDLVVLSARQSSGRNLVVDGEGDTLPSQRLSTGELAVLARDVPPMGVLRVYLRKGDAQSEGRTTITGTTIGNDDLEASVNTKTGALGSFVWKRNGLQLVDATRGAGLNEYLYVPGTNPADAKRLTGVKAQVKERGPLVASILVRAVAEGCREYESEFFVVAGIDRIDVINRIDKMAVRMKEGVHFAFPLAVNDGQLRYDVADGIVRPEADQLPGACKNFFSVQGWVDVSNEQRGVTWATLDAPLIEVGEITAEKPWLKSIKPAQNFYSYVMNNYWHTNYKADQQGVVEFRYSLHPHGPWSAGEAVRFGIERRQPLVVSIADTTHEPMASLFQLGGQHVVALSTHRIAGENAWLVFLYNPSDGEQSVAIRWNPAIPVNLFASDLFGKPGGQLNGAVSLMPFTTAYVLVKTR